MALYVKDPEVDALAEQLMALKRVNKTEAVRQALQHELEREAAKPSSEKRSLEEITREFQQRLREKGNPEKGLPVDKAFIDSLYEDD